MTVDKQIADTFAALGVLLVFVIAYFSALLPTVESTINKDTPADSYDKAMDRGRARNQFIIILGVAVINLGVLVLVVPLSWQAIITWPNDGGWPSKSFPTVRGALLLIDFLLLLTSVALGWLAARLVRKWYNLR